MFGWLKKTVHVEQAAGDKAPQNVTLMFDSNGRAVRPDMPGLQVPDEASDAQIGIAIAWARAWNSETEMFAGEVDLIAAVRQAMSGRPPKAKDPSRHIVSSACRCLHLAAQDNRAIRTMGAFPWVQFRLGPQERSCSFAISLTDQIIPFDDRPRLPLPGCNASECKCWLRQVTKAEAAKRKSA